MLILLRDINESTVIETGYVVQTLSNNRFSIFSETEKEETKTLQIGEFCTVAPGVEMHYLGLQGTKRRVGFKADRSIGIYRAEVFKEMKTEQALAKALTPNSKINAA